MPPLITGRDEVTIFSDLEKLCASSGFVHALAYISWKNNMTYLGASDEMSGDVFANRPESLLRTEIAILIGLTAKHSINTDLPESDVIQQYLESSITLLEELHYSMMRGAFSNPEKFEEGLNQADFWREAIFYAAESAFQFQYRELAKLRYSDDKAWLNTNRGFDLDIAQKLFSAISDIQRDKLNSLHLVMDKSKPESWTLLPAFIINLSELETQSGLSLEIISSFLNGFGLTAPDNASYTSMTSFNKTNACPLIWLNEHEFMCIQTYSLAESLYESPIFWMNEDKAYKNVANENRGRFTEQFSASRLRVVFGANRVFTNVNISSDKEVLAEADVLVLFGDRAIIVQAKSKKLTIAARSGDAEAVKDDFQKAVQSAYGQAFTCGELMLQGGCTFSATENSNLIVGKDFKEIFVFCLTSDHYPSVGFQAKQFLEIKEHPIIKAPFVMDVFFLDVYSEFLTNPIYFLDYARRRSDFSMRMMSFNEFSTLSHHLQKNLWIEDNIAGFILEDNVSSSLDAAFIVRREGLAGNPTPEGILTKFKNTFFEGVLDLLATGEKPAFVDFGYFLLGFNEETIQSINKTASRICAATRADGLVHDFMILAKGGGLTVHCSTLHPTTAMTELQNHCELRKYIHKEHFWFGVLLAPTELTNIIGLTGLHYPWEFSQTLQTKIETTRLKKVTKNLTDAGKRASRKIGRNESCPCGSGKKYKHCHLKN